MAEENGSITQIQKMVSEENEDNYITCSCCKSKYINDNETIVKMFGYNRMQKRYKTCLTCRTKKKKPPAPEEQKEEIIRCIYNINHWEKEEKLVDEYDGDIRWLVRNERFHTIKRLSDKV